MKRALISWTATLAAVSVISLIADLNESSAAPEPARSRVERRSVRERVQTTGSASSRSTSDVTTPSAAAAPESDSYSENTGSTNTDHYGTSVSNTNTPRGTAQTYPASEDPESLSSSYESESSTTYTQSAAERPVTGNTGNTATGDTGRDFAGKQMFFAPKLGAALPIDLAGNDSVFTWGGEIGFRTSEKSTLGLNVLTSSSNGLRITPLTLKLSFYPNLGNGFHIGPQVGMVKESAVTRAGRRTPTQTEFGAGVVLGYDYQITPIFSTGLEINHVSVFGSDLYHLVNIVVPFKVHF